MQRFRTARINRYQPDRDLFRDLFIYIAGMNIRVKTKHKAKGYRVFIALSDGGEPKLIAATKQIVPVKDWSIKHNMPKSQSGKPYKDIVKVQAKINQIISGLEAEDNAVITPEKVQRLYKEHLKQKEKAAEQYSAEMKAEAVTVISLVEHYRDHLTFNLKPTTRRSVKCSLKKFIGYLNKKKLSTLGKGELNRDIISAYESSLVDENFSINGRGTKMKHLRWALNSFGYDTSKIKAVSFRRRIISLTFDELTKLNAVDVSKLVEWQKAKDIFLLMCFTGFRISDIKRINKVNSRNGFISLQTVKNMKYVRVPILKDCQDILDRYDGGAPKFPDQKVNEFIKKVCIKAKINEPTEIEYTKGTVILTKIKPKHDLITSHIAVKTFITLAYSRWGMTPAEIAHITGKSLQVLLTHYFNDQSESGRQKMIANDVSLPLMKVS